MDPITVAKLWMVVKPIKRIKEARQRRRAERMAEKVILTTATGETIEHTPPTIKARTSTKMGAVGASVFLATAAAIIPNWDGINSALLQACQSEQGPAWGLGLMGGMLAVNFVTARLTKSPLTKQAL